MDDKGWSCSAVNTTSPYRIDFVSGPLTSGWNVDATLCRMDLNRCLWKFSELIKLRWSRRSGFLACLVRSLSCINACWCPGAQIDLSSRFKGDERASGVCEYFLIIPTCSRGKQIPSLILGGLKMFLYYAACLIGAVKAKSY